MFAYLKYWGGGYKDRFRWNPDLSHDYHQYDAPECLHGVYPCVYRCGRDLCIQKNMNIKYFFPGPNSVLFLQTHANTLRNPLPIPKCSSLTHSPFTKSSNQAASQPASRQSATSPLLSYSKPHCVPARGKHNGAKKNPASARADTGLGQPDKHAVYRHAVLRPQHAVHQHREAVDLHMSTTGPWMRRSNETAQKK